MNRDEQLEEGQKVDISSDGKNLGEIKVDRPATMDRRMPPEFHQVFTCDQLCVKEGAISRHARYFTGAQKSRLNHHRDQESSLSNHGNRVLADSFHHLLSSKMRHEPIY